MRNVERDVPLAPLTTLGLGGPAKRFVRLERAEDLEDVLAIDEPLLVLGGGSNLVVSDAGFAGTVVQIAHKGITVHGRDDSLVNVAAGESWDDFVAQMVEAGRAGVECMSGIPGLVGATPMQNVGAYGQEVSDSIHMVWAWDRETGKREAFEPARCGFGYRTSMFRGSSRWIISSVSFHLPPSELSKPLKYAELVREVGERAPLKTVRDAVIALRKTKGMVVDPADPESRSAGSFFTNPIVEAARVPAGAPNWPQPDGRVKISAAWLIERAGFQKGYTQGGVGISRKHALALVNRGGTTQELLALARSIQERVEGAFGVRLEPEPIIV